MACDRCDSLTRQLREAREELAEWKRSGGGEAQGPGDADDKALVQVWREALEVQPQVARLLVFLCRWRGEQVSNDRIMNELWGADRLAELEAPDKALMVRVHHARTRLKALFGKGLIDTVWGYGLTISRGNADRLHTYVAEAEARRAAA